MDTRTGPGQHFATPRYVGALALLLFAPAVVSAQTEEIQKDIDKALQQARMYEDIEIMRRLLHRKIDGLARSCLKCHNDPDADAMGDMMAGGMEGAAGGMMPMMPGPGMGGMAGMPGMAMGPMAGGRVVWSDTTTVDGVHIPGHGVIFQVEVPALLAILPPVTGRPEPKGKLSEWELIRKQLRGEKVPAPASTANPHQPGFQEVVTSTLAEYGKNFRALSDKEKLTVSVTFRTRAPQPPVGGMPMGGMMGPTGIGPGGGAGPMGGGFDAGGGGDPMGAVPAGPMSPMPGGAPMPASGEGPGGFGSPGGSGGLAGGGAPGLPGTPGGSRTGNTSRDHELLADFHIRQGRYDEAARSLLKAIALNTDVSRSSGLQRKLAISYLMQDQYQRPDADAVAKAMDAFKKALDGKKTGTATSARPLSLPKRLIISVPRQALQSNSLEGATIQWLRFDHPAVTGSN
jgi:hypothetical protein